MSSCATRTRPRGRLERVADVLEQVANSKIAQAAQLLADAAALYEEFRRHTEMRLGIESQLWFLTRALSAEHALNYDQLVARARACASEVAAAQSRD
jgi:hypothetical protein